ncbi:YnbE family lipoprotein [Rhizorhapis suberifaciens]|nr:YnbE family lipoprotein [Rhizorhapis suberifaciens]
MIFRIKGYGRGVSSVLGLVLVAGCIQVKAPDKPIEINLNVRVQQEVIVKLQKDAEELIENNPELFPQ